MAETIRSDASPDFQRENTINKADAPAAQLNLRRLEKFQRLFLFSAVFVLLLLISLIIFSAVKLYDIKKEIAINDKLLKQQGIVMKQNDATLARQQESIAKLQSSNNVLQQTTLSLSSNPDLAVAIKKTVESNISRQTDSKQIQPRVYIQIANNEQRPSASTLALLLQAKGFIVPGIENMQGKTRSLTESELRYYGSGNYNQSDLDMIIQVFRNASSSKLKPTPLTASGNVRPKHYEIWLADDFIKQDIVIRPTEPKRPVQDPPPVVVDKVPVIAYQTIITDTRFTGVNYFSDIRNKAGQTVVTAHVTSVDRSLDQATMYISAGSERTPIFNLKANQPAVQYLNGNRYKVTVTATRFGKPRAVRIAYYNIQVEERVN